MMNQTYRMSFYRQLGVALIAAAVTIPALSAQAPYRQDYGRSRSGENHSQHQGRDYRNNGRDYHQNERDYHQGGRGDNGGAVLVGALLGVAAGVAISNSYSRPPPDVVYRRDPPPPPPGVVYYDNGY